MKIFKQAARQFSSAALMLLLAIQTNAESSVLADDETSKLLQQVIDNRTDEAKARDKWRNPYETLQFFGMQPDHFVVEMMPGEGQWYTDIIAPYVAEKGRLAAVAYQLPMYFAFLINPDAARAERIITWKDRFPPQATEKYNLAQPAISLEFGKIPNEINGQVDMVVMIRELHNYWRVRGENNYAEEALQDTFNMLKPGGVVGVVQHRAPEDAEGMAGDGSFGYMKQSEVIRLFEDAGFIFEASTELNANPKDNPETEQLSEGVFPVVWRLPPFSIYGEKDKEIFEAVGESDRMTLRFRKPEK